MFPLSERLLKSDRLYAAPETIQSADLAAAAPARAWYRIPKFSVHQTKTFLASLSCILVVATALTSYFIIQSQSALKHVSQYNLTWMASVAPVEVTRLEASVAESTMPNSMVGQEQIQLRLDIVRNRINVLENSDVGKFIRDQPDLARILAHLRAMIDQAQPLVDTLGHEGSAQELIKIISPVGPQLVKMAAAANAQDAETVVLRQNHLNRLHIVFTVITGCLVVCGFGLLWTVTWHNRLLSRAHAEVNVLVQSLQDRDRILDTQNERFDVALNNMSQALCMVDRAQRIIVCNVRFLELFDLPAAMAQPGTLLADVFRDAAALGRYKLAMLQAVGSQQQALITAGRAGHFFHEDPNGQALAVSHQPMPGSGWVATYEDISERRQAEARIWFMAHHDTLTGLPNRGLFEERVGHALTGARRDDGEVAVLCLDLDHFKEVNDSLGHPAGDQLLKIVAQRLLGCVRSGDVVARLGGDEFAILQQSARQPGQAEALARRVIHAISAPYDLNGTTVVIGTSVGIALAGVDEGGLSNLLKHADIALYKAKGGGGASYRIFEPEMDDQLRARRAMESDLRDALANGELEVFYQPLFDLVAEGVNGFEALLRWKHPEVGMIPPAEFIPIAEETGLIVDIGIWVLNQACQEAATWPGGIKVAVNLSPVQFRGNETLVATVQAALSKSGLDPQRLALEITESALLKDSDKVLATLHALRALGVEIALDDFGTGYSSLSYLRSFPFDKIKIDQSFVREMGNRKDCLAIVQSVAQLALKLGMATTAEGVETLEQLEQVRAAGCTHAQGYYFDQPKPPAAIRHWFMSSQEYHSVA